MQNKEPNRKSGAVRKFFQEKGYYIVLFLCIAAVGISGYIFVSGALAEKHSLQQPAMAVATPATVPQAEKPAQTAKPSDPAASGSADDARETAAITADDAVRQQAEGIRVWPVSGTAIGGYSMDKLAWNETTHDWRTHDGMDLAAVSGEPVMAAAAGTVSAVYDDEFFGTTVAITHDGGYVTRYQNLTAMPTVSAGQRVSAGQTIGAVGATALLEVSEQPHLHFVVEKNGVSVDPMEFLD